jgi:hypothetical protein
MGRWPNLKTPKRFTEKIQIYKMTYRNPVLPTCVDKFDVREYVKGKKLANILNDLYGVYNSLDEIDWNLSCETKLM